MRSSFQFNADNASLNLFILRSENILMRGRWFRLDVGISLRSRKLGKWSVTSVRIFPVVILDLRHLLFSLTNT